MPGDQSTPRPPDEDARGPEPGTGTEPEGDAAPQTGERGAVRCDLCGGEMMELHCRLICTRCGYERDCSDP